MFGSSPSAVLSTRCRCVGLSPIPSYHAIVLEEIPRRPFLTKESRFSTQSLSISVVKFTLDDASVDEDLEGSNQSYDPNGDKKYLYTYKYTTYSDVKGARNIKE